MIEKKLTISVDADNQVSAILTGPDHLKKASDTGLVLAHGASNDMNNPLIVALAKGLAASGWVTLRFNFPYKEQGRKSPDGQARLEQAWMAAWQALATSDQVPVKRLVAVGKSMGGRVASQLVAAGRLPADGLIFLGYPLHAPGKKDRLRDGHLYDISAPMLYFSGTRDPLCNIEKLNGVLGRLAAPWALKTIDGGNHSLLPAKPSADSQAAIYQGIVDHTADWLVQHNLR